MDAPKPPCLETKLSKVSEWSGESCDVAEAGMLTHLEEDDTL